MFANQGISYRIVPLHAKIKQQKENTCAQAMPRVGFCSRCPEMQTSCPARHSSTARPVRLSNFDLRRVCSFFPVCSFCFWRSFPRSSLFLISLLCYLEREFSEIGQLSSKQLPPAKLMSVGKSSSSSSSSVKRAWTSFKRSTSAKRLTVVRQQGFRRPVLNNSTILPASNVKFE